MWKREKYVMRIDKICQLLKKYKPMQRVNYGVTKLSNTTCEVPSAITCTRLFSYAENAVFKYRSEFYSGKITVDQIST
jgi:hypothetical protein